MADQRIINLYPGDGTPKDIVLRPLPVADLPAGTTIYLRQGDATAKDIVLRNPTEAPASGPITITGTLSATDSADTAAFSGIVTKTITGTLAATDSADAAAFAGDLDHVGTLAATDTADSAAFSGDLVHVGSLSVTDSPDSATFSGAVAHVGSLSATDDADGFESDGTVSSGGVTITGDLSVTDGADSAQLLGEVISITSRVSGGIGHNRKKKDKPIWIEREGKILVFRNPTDASNYLAQQKPEQKAIKKQKPVTVELVIDLPEIKTYESRLKVEFDDLVKVPTQANDANIALLIELARKVQEWLDDEETILLLAA